MRPAATGPGVRGGHDDGPSSAEVRGSCSPGDVALSPAGQVVVTAAAVVGAWALVLRSVDLVVVVAPLLVAIAVDVAAFAPTRVDLRAVVERDRCMEGRRLAARLEVRRAAAGPRWLAPTTSAAVQVPDPLQSDHATTAAPTGSTGAATRPLEAAHGVHVDLVTSDAATVGLTLVAPRWGAAGRWPVVVTWRSALGLVATHGRTDLRGDNVRVLPSLRERVGLLEPPHAGAWSGVLPAAARTGQGVEFAGLRPFRRGDRPRDVHARATARHGAPWVASRHPERNREVVVLLDQLGREALVDAVRVVTALSDVHVAARDRVGLVALGQPLRWVVPGVGERQRLRLLDAAMDVSAAVSQVEPKLDRVHVVALPPGALVVVVAHLSERTEHVVRDLRSRRRDVVVVDLDVPRPSLPPREAQARRRTTVLDQLLLRGDTRDDWSAHGPRSSSHVDVEDLAWRLHGLERAERRARCRSHGATVLRHEVGASTAVAVATLGRALRARTHGAQA